MRFLHHLGLGGSRRSTITSKKKKLFQKWHFIKKNNKNYYYNIILPFKPIIRITTNILLIFLDLIKVIKKTVINWFTGRKDTWKNCNQIMALLCPSNNPNCLPDFKSHILIVLSPEPDISFFSVWHQNQWNYTI